MKLSDFEFASNQFYKYTHIPIFLIQNKTIIYPELNLTNIQKEEIKTIVPMLNGIIESNILDPIISDGIFMLAQLYVEIDGQQLKAIVGPTRILGQITSIPNLTFISFDFSSETESEFINHVKFACFLLNSSIGSNYKFSLYNNDIHVNTNKNRFINILSERRDHSYTKDSYQMELRIIHYIRTQKPDKIKWIIKSLEKENSTSLSKNTVLSLRYKFVSFVAILTRQAISDGIPLDIAFSLSDSLIKELDNLDTSRQIIDFILYACEHFILLYKGKSIDNLSSEIKQTINYIDRHLYKKISLQEISTAINIVPTYLSFKFKKETGTKLSDYILSQRVEESKELLLFTNKSYQEIASQLNFSSQSYFIKCFKTTTGITPKEFREKNWQYNIWD